MNATVIIPARYSSKRFSGKPLVKIAGKSMVQRVYENAEKAKKTNRVFVATDDERIAEAVLKFGGKYIMTSEKHTSGTDRVGEAADIIGLKDNDIIINVQGDQPMFDYRCLDQLVEPFEEGFDSMTTLIYKIVDPNELTNPKDVKTVFDNQGFAIYFSRLPIPYDRDGSECDRYKHLGFYAYTKKFLDKFRSLPEGNLEKTEKLEQARALENGMKIKTIITEYDSFEVDTPEDIKKAEKIIAGKYQHHSSV